MLGGGGYEVSTMPVVYPLGTVSVSSFGSFSSVGSSSKPSHSSFPLSLYLISRYIQDYFKKKRGRDENSLIHSRRSPGARRRGSK